MSTTRCARLFYRALRVIEHAFSARREYMTKEGEILYGGPDHYARLAAHALNHGNAAQGGFTSVVSPAPSLLPRCVLSLGPLHAGDRSSGPDKEEDQPDARFEIPLLRRRRVSCSEALAMWSPKGC